METNKEIIDDFTYNYKKLKNEISKIIVGQEVVLDQVLLSIFCNGHCLLEGVPGLAKTLLINTIAKCLGLDFNRIQFTPDLMPSDIIGSEILDGDRNFKFIKGPLFSNIILADEINRTPPKTQSALLEAMQERHVTNSGNIYKLPKPFFVLATQNPIEQEGTYPLPEAQLDRFMLNIIFSYPSIKEEIEIVNRTIGRENPLLNKIISSEQILQYQDIISKIPITSNVIEYAVNLVSKTRPNTTDNNFISEFVDWGAGPRASQFLVLAAKCNSVIKGKYTPDIEDIKEVSIPVLRHRIVKNYKADAEGIGINEIIENIL